MGGSPRVSAALCCLNERGNLPTVVDRLKRLARQLGGQLQEAVVVDGGSTDGTWEYLEQAALEWPVLKPARQRPPAGKGSGHRQAVQACRGEIIITCGTDLNYDITDAARMLPLLSEADLVVANPFLRGAGFRLNLFREALTRGVSLLYRLALAGRKRVGTVFTPSFRAGKAEVFQKTMPRSNDFTASAEFMVRVYLTTCARVIEMPVSVYPRGAGRSKLPKFRTVLGHLRLAGRILAFRMRLRRGF